MTKQSDIFGASTDTLGLPAIKPPDAYPLVASNNVHLSSKENLIPGFVGDGDYMLLPILTGASGSLTYYNAAGTLQWTLVIGDLANGMDEFSGFFFKGSLLYVFSQDTATNPDTFQTQTVDVAKTITVIGNDLPDNANLQQGAFSNTVSDVNSTQVLPHPNGTDAIWYKHIAHTATSYYGTTSLSTGQFVISLPTDIVTAAATVNPLASWFVTPNGAIVWLVSNAQLHAVAVPDFGAAVRSGNQRISLNLDARDLIGVVWKNSYKPIYYQNDATGIDVIVFVDPKSAADGVIPRVFGRTALETWGDAIAQLAMGAGLTS